MANEPKKESTLFCVGSGKILTARIETPAGVTATQAAITSLTVVAKDHTGTVIGSTALDKTAVIFDTVQGSSLSDSRWRKDVTGYNFRWELPASWLTAASPGVRVGLMTDFASGENQYGEWYGPVQDIVTT